MNYDRPLFFLLRLDRLLQDIVYGLLPAVAEGRLRHVIQMSLNLNCPSLKWFCVCLHVCVCVCVHACVGACGWVCVCVCVCVSERDGGEERYFYNNDPLPFSSKPCLSPNDTEKPYAPGKGQELTDSRQAGKAATDKHHLHVPALPLCRKRAVNDRVHTPRLACTCVSVGDSRTIFGLFIVIIYIIVFCFSPFTAMMSLENDQ